jgi:carbon starvation protein
VATTIIVKMGRARFIAVTLIPLCWLVTVTFTASWHKIFDPNPRIGFLTHARQLAAAGANPRLIFNDRLDAAVTGVLVVMVAMILIESSLECTRVISGSKSATTKEAPFVMTKLAAGEQA